jgi:endonuclease-3
MPVDTHIARVMTRLGVVPDRTSTVTKQRILTDLIGPHAPTIFAVHVETIEHGRTVCRARRPRCEACPLQDLCDYYLQHVDSNDQEESGE